MIIAVNEIGEFSCKAHCIHSCSAYWVINGKNTQFDPFRSESERMGFIFPEVNPRRNGTEYVLSLRVNASDDNNNSMIQCGYTSNHYPFAISRSNRTAKLLVLSGEYTCSDSLTQ